MIELHIAPLRDRREDIPYLTASFVREFAQRLNRPLKGITPAAERLLQNAPWPGNVRELRNVIERACILSDGRVVTERELTSAMSLVPSSDARSASGARASGGVNGQESASSLAASARDASLMSTAQRQQIERVLSQVSGNKAAAAKQLGISRRSLYRWLDRLNIPA